MGAIDLGQYIWPDAAQGRQPQGFVRANPRIRGLVAAINAAAPAEAVRGQQAVGWTAAGGTSVPSVPGVGLKAVSGITYRICTYPELDVGTGDFSAIALIDGAASGTYVAIGRYNGSSPDSAWWLGTSGSTWTFSTGPSNLTGGTIDANPHCIIATRIGGNKYIYVDGAPVAGPVADSASLSSGSALAICSFDNLATYFWPGSVYTGAFLARGLTSAEAQAIGTNPWSLFADQILPFHIPNGLFPTLSAAGYAAGTLGSTSFTPEVTFTR